jgi:hypothetical protein
MKDGAISLIFEFLDDSGLGKGLYGRRIRQVNFPKRIGDGNSKAISRDRFFIPNSALGLGLLDKKRVNFRLNYRDFPQFLWFIGWERSEGNQL